MTAHHLPGDQAFFAEWAAKRRGERRSLKRAHAVGSELGIWNGTPPVLAVVGSKGKGTTAVHAAATLSAAIRPKTRGRAHVGLVTSPGLRTNRERMRLDGAAISPAGYEAEAARLTAARAAVVSDSSGYLSPTGAYTITGASWATVHGADVLVLEEGLGGRSDEVSLFEPRVVAVTKVFYEHGELLGPTLEDVARDLLGVVGRGTRTIVMVEQDPEVTALVVETAARFETELLTVGAGAPTCAPEELAPLTRLNAKTGEAAARVLAADLGWSLDDDAVTAVFRTVHLPGRMSRYPTAAGPVMVDGAISREGVRATVDTWRSWRAELGYDDGLGTVVASFPDTKDTAACFEELSGFDRIVPSRADDYLTFTKAEALHGEVLPAREALASGLADGGCLVVGTQSFLGIALDALDVPTDVAYEISG